MMEEQIAHFPEQFSFHPAIENAEALPVERSRLIVAGMGGSVLGARLLLSARPGLDILLHSDYGLPAHARGRLIVASSYSGDTEEVLDTAHAALGEGLPLAVVTGGGALMALAREHRLPLIVLPKLPMEPRMAVGVSMLALAKLTGDAALEEEVRAAGSGLDVKAFTEQAAELADRLAGSVPLIYSSTENAALAYFWKIAINETAKAPAFMSVFPEVCHNELSGFDVAETTRGLTADLHTLFLLDSDDEPRVGKRMRIMKDLLHERSIAHATFDIVGAGAFEKVFNTLLGGVWTAVALAKRYGVQNATTPLIKEFKDKMRQA